jgi:hypothetical protein
MSYYFQMLSFTPLNSDEGGIGFLNLYPSMYVCFCMYIYTQIYMYPNNYGTQQFVN